MAELQKITKNRIGMFQELGFPLLLFIARHTKLTIFMLKFLTALVGRTKRIGKVPFAMRGNFCFEVDKYKIQFWINPIGKSDESRYLFLIETKSNNPFNLAYQELSFA